MKSIRDKTIIKVFVFLISLKPFGTIEVKVDRSFESNCPNHFELIMFQGMTDALLFLMHLVIVINQYGRYGY